MNTLLNSQVFYRKYGVRTSDQLIAPTRHPVFELALPQNSVYHHIEYDGISIGPSADCVGTSNQIKNISLINVAELEGSDGAPKKQNISVAQLEKQIITRNRRLRITRNMASVLADHNTLLCINYNFLFQSWKYVRAQYSEIFKWRNAFQTVIKQVTELTKTSERQHFLFAGAAPIMPSVSQLNACVDQIGSNLIGIYNKPNALLLLELWKWIGSESRQTSFLSKIPINKIHLVNLVFCEAGQYCVINLGYLNAFRVDSNKIKSIEPGDPNTPFLKPISPVDPFSLQKRLLMFFMKLVEVTNESANAQDDPIEARTTEDDTEKKDDGLPLPNSSQPSDLKSVEELSAGEGQELSEKEQKALREEQDRQIDEVLSQLENISMRRSIDEDGDALITTKEIMQSKPVGLDEAIEMACQRLENTGSLSAAQYKMFMNASGQYKTMKDPFGQGNIPDALVIEPTELLITKKKLPDSVTVHDKSMLRDTLSSYDDDYVKKILPKHLTQMTMSAQRAGYCVTEFTAEKKGDIMGEFHDIRLSLLPVEGSASTIHMKLPVVDNQGVIRSNDINYRLKKLRVDIPIRKIASDRVSLTSYYGKTFVYRGRRKNHDFGHWLRNQIMLKSFNEQDKDIGQCSPTPGFSPDFKAPKAYTDISLGFRFIKVRGFDCFFNEEQAIKAFGENFWRRHLEQNIWPIGIKVVSGGAQEFVLMDQYGAVSIKNKDGKTEDVGTVANFLNISVVSAPVDFAEVSILGADVPVGVALAYYMGLNNLFKALGITPARYEAGRRFSLGETEFAIQFLDETLVFDRQNKLACMIVGGFASYYRTCKKYSVYAFDKTAVYFNVFESNGLSARYLREMDLVDKMFVDPITMELLQEMKEPTNWQGLLIRSCEMLLNDQHKDPLDLSEQRLRGYERMAGAIYTELVRSVRQHQGMTGKATKKLEMNPYAVWKRIFEDPAKEQVVEINPIRELRHKEAVTFSGEGGRSKETMNKESREFSLNDTGVISESTSDSSDVGINTYTSASPNISSMTGLTNRFDMNRDGVTSILSTSALLSPVSDKDD